MLVLFFVVIAVVVVVYIIRAGSAASRGGQGRGGYEPRPLDRDDASSYLGTNTYLHHHQHGLQHGPGVGGAYDSTNAADFSGGGSDYQPTEYGSSSGDFGGFSGGGDFGGAGAGGDWGGSYDGGSSSSFDSGGGGSSDSGSGGSF